MRCWCSLARLQYRPGGHGPGSGSRLCWGSRRPIQAGTLKVSPAMPETLWETRRCRPFPTQTPGAQPGLLTRLPSRGRHSTVTPRVSPATSEALLKTNHYMLKNKLSLNSKIESLSRRCSQGDGESRTIEEGCEKQVRLAQR